MLLKIIKFEEMESDKKDIRQFDLLEKSDIPEDKELAAIKKMDGLVGGISMKEVRSDFTSWVILSAIVLAKRKANSRILYWLIGVFCVMSILSFFIFPTGSEITTPEFVPIVFDQLGKYLAVFEDPKLKQFLIIAEGIICLVILEKIVSSYKYFKHPAH